MSINWFNRPFRRDVGLRTGAECIRPILEQGPTSRLIAATASWCECGGRTGDQAGEGSAVYKEYRTRRAGGVRDYGRTVPPSVLHGRIDVLSLYAAQNTYRVPGTVERVKFHNVEIGSRRVMRLERDRHRVSGKTWTRLHCVASVSEGPRRSQPVERIGVLE